MNAKLKKINNIVVYMNMNEFMTNEKDQRIVRIELSQNSALQIKVCREEDKVNNKESKPTEEKV